MHTLRSGYRRFLKLDEEDQLRARFMVHRSIADALPEILNNVQVDPDLPDYALALTFATPGIDAPYDYSKTVIRTLPKPNNVSGLQFFNYVQDMITFERQLGGENILQHYQASQDALGENAELIAVSAVMGLINRCVIDDERGVLIVTHNPNNANSAYLINEQTELLRAGALDPGHPVKYNGENLDIVTDLAMLYDLVTTSGEHDLSSLLG